MLRPVGSPLRATLVGVAGLLECVCGARFDIVTAAAAAAVTAAVTAAAVAAAAASFTTFQGVCDISMVLGGSGTGSAPFGPAAPSWLPGKVRGVDGETVALDGRRSGTADNRLEEVFPLRDDSVLFVQTESSRGRYNERGGGNNVSECAGTTGVDPAKATVGGVETEDAFEIVLLFFSFRLLLRLLVAPLSPETAHVTCSTHEQEGILSLELLCFQNRTYLRMRGYRGPKCKTPTKSYPIELQVKAR